MSKPGKNTEPSPMTHEVIHMPSLGQLRSRVAMDAESMTVTDLQAAAAEAQIDTSGAKTKEQLVNTVRSAARGADVPPTSTGEK